MTKSECRVKPETRIVVQASCLLAFALGSAAVPARAADLPTYQAMAPLPVQTLVYHSQNSTGKFWLGMDPAWRHEVVRLTGTRCAALHELTGPIVASMRASLNRPIGLAIWVGFEDPRTQDACAITPRTAEAYGELDRLCQSGQSLLGDLVVHHLMIDYEAWRPTGQTFDVVSATMTCHDIGLLQRLSRVSQILRDRFPAAEQHWYHAGQMELIRGNWQPYSFGAEWLPIRPPVSCTLYEWDAHYDRMVDKLDKNLERAARLGVNCNPIVSIGAEYVTELWVKPDGYTVAGTPIPVAGQPPRFYLPRRIEAWKMYEAGRRVFYGSAHNVRIKTATIYPGPADDTPCPGAGGAPLNKWWRHNFGQLVLGARQRPVPPGLGNTVEGDFDGDGDVDMDDFGIFQRCATGSGVPGK